MILYHGSNTIIEQIDLSKSRPGKDFGQGFYLSSVKEQAHEMAMGKVAFLGGTPVVTSFEFDSDHLKNGRFNVKIFESYSKEWAQFVYDNRENYTNTPIHQFDIIYGPIANDNVGAQIRNYKSGHIDLDELLKRIKYLKGITFQNFFGTEAAIQTLQKL